jgi:hypothetical protein
MNAHIDHGQVAPGVGDAMDGVDRYVQSVRSSSHVSRVSAQRVRLLSGHALEGVAAGEHNGCIRSTSGWSARTTAHASARRLPGPTR